MLSTKPWALALLPSGTCYRLIVARLRSPLSNPFRRMLKTFQHQRLCSDSIHVTAPYKLSFINITHTVNTLTSLSHHAPPICLRHIGAMEDDLILIWFWQMRYSNVSVRKCRLYCGFVGELHQRHRSPVARVHVERRSQPVESRSGADLRRRKPRDAVPGHRRAGVDGPQRQRPPWTMVLWRPHWPISMQKLFLLLLFFHGRRVLDNVGFCLLFFRFLVLYLMWPQLRQATGGTRV